MSRVHIWEGGGKRGGEWEAGVAGARSPRNLLYPIAWTTTPTPHQKRRQPRPLTPRATIRSSRRPDPASPEHPEKADTSDNATGSSKRLSKLNLAASSKTRPLGRLTIPQSAPI